MARKTTCEMCGDRFEGKRDTRRWKASATPVPVIAAETTRVRAKALIVCTDCFLELAETDYGV